MFMKLILDLTWNAGRKIEFTRIWHGATGDDLDHDGDGSAYDDIDDDSDGVAGDEIDVMAMKSTMMATARNFVTMVLLPS